MRSQHQARRHRTRAPERLLMKIINSDFALSALE
jgi:hypothetical protein